MKTPEDEAFEEIERIQRTRTRWVSVEKPQREFVGLTDKEIDRGLLRSGYALEPAAAWRAGVVFAMNSLNRKNTRREWTRLTDKEIEECWDGDLSPYQMQCIREIESRLREKNHA
jgi:hypothetical protein